MKAFRKKKHTTADCLKKLRQADNGFREEQLRNQDICAVSFSISCLFVTFCDLGFLYRKSHKLGKESLIRISS